MPAGELWRILKGFILTQNTTFDTCKSQWETRQQNLRQPNTDARYSVFSRIVELPYSVQP